MERIMICGGPGAGKSVLARRLAHALQLHHTDLDELVFEPGWRRAPREVLLQRVARATAGSGWVLAGDDMESVAELVWPRLTTLIVLDLPLPLRLMRVLRRALWRRLTRQTFCNGNVSTWARAIHPEGALRYSLRTCSERRAAYAGWHRLDALQHVQLVHLRRPAQVASFCADIETTRAEAILAR